MTDMRLQVIIRLGANTLTLYTDTTAIGMGYGVEWCSSRPATGNRAVRLWKQWSKGKATKGLRTIGEADRRLIEFAAHLTDSYVFNRAETITHGFRLLTFTSFTDNVMPRLRLVRGTL